MQLNRSKKPKSGRIEIIPMIDIMFFLLATFIIASLAMQNINSIAVNLPQGKAENINIHKKITLSIDSKNNIYLNQSAIPIEQIGPQIKSLIDSGFDDTIIINADQNSYHGIVSQSMLKAKEAGAKHFSIVTKQ